ncbi:MAG: sigma-70 family RNA polymerase sigma factor [Chitinophagales bacterium]|jgi:RNA polymerase sigma-70 factor (ECF subfamily)|nr:sigma-70 family RNA polymerase sigma factor [Chitinophagales bacterium]
MQTQILNDEALVLQYMNGNEQSLEILIRRHKSKIFTSIFMFLRDQYLAEDLFQETFIKVVRKLRAGQYQEEGKFLPWVMRISHNLCIDFYRKTRRTPQIVTPEGFDIFNVLQFSDGNPENMVIRKQSHERVRAMVDELPVEQKEVVILRHYADLSFKEIAEITNVSINTALGRMRYALINLRKMQMEKQIAL